MKARLRTPKQGLALVGILLMLTILAMVAVLLAGLGSANQRLARSETESDKAVYAAEAGLTIALESYLQDATYNGNTVPQAFGQSGQTFQITLYTETSPPPSGAAVPPNHVLVSSQGYAGQGASRTVSALVTMRKPTEAQDNALYAGRRVNIIDGGVAVSNANVAAMMAGSPPNPQGGWWQALQALIQQHQQGIQQAQQQQQQAPSQGTSPMAAMAAMKASAPKPVMRAMTANSAPTSGGTITKSATLQKAALSTAPAPASSTGTKSASGNTTAHIAVDSSSQDGITLGVGTGVEGEIRIPSGSDAGVVFNDNSGGNHSGVNDSYLPPTMVPVRLPLVPGDTDITLTANSSFGGGQLQPGAYGHVVVDGGVLELNSQDLQNAAANGESPKDMYVFKSLTLRNGGKVVLKSDAANIDLTAGLYIDEKFEVVNGSLENETNDPARLQVYVMDNAPVSMNFDGDSHATLYAPGSRIDFTGGNLFGSVVGEEIVLDLGASVFYDEVLAGLSPDPWGNGGFYAERKSYRRD